MKEIIEWIKEAQSNSSDEELNQYYNILQYLAQVDI